VSTGTAAGIEDLTLPRPVFVLGAPRSGTSMLAWALARHDALWTSGESGFIFQLFGRGQIASAHGEALARAGDSFLTREGVSEAELHRFIGRGIDALYLTRSGGRRWIDHTPHYALMLDVLTALFPAAKVVHILRDGRRVVHSMMHFSEIIPLERREEMSAAGILPRWAADFAFACETWAKYVQELKRLEGDQPDKCMTVRNEDLVMYPDDHFANILDFLEVDQSTEPAKYFASHRFNSSFESNTRKGMTAADLTRPWEKWTVEEAQVFEETTRRVLDLRTLDEAMGLARAIRSGDGDIDGEG
jgi:hypothetical protein